MGWFNFNRVGLIGMNGRNADLIGRYNSRKLFPLVDDKLLTKKLAIDAGIRVPDLYGVVEIEHQNRRLGELLAGHNDFVIKPVHGSGGNGIIVISGKMNDQYRKHNGVLLSEKVLKHHVSNILSGLHSLGGRPDKALIESRVEYDPVFENVTNQGVPDIRLIVFRGVPAMAMVRLPTRESDGRANLHQGALGVGIDMKTGTTVSAVAGNEFVDCHPDTGCSVIGLTIPYWPEIMLLAARCYGLAPLDYMGVDVVLDKHQGPMVLELNARPGLTIQLANQQGLQQQLAQLKKLKTIPSDPQLRVDLALTAA